MTTEQRRDEPGDSTIAGATSEWRRRLLAFESMSSMQRVVGADVLVAMRVFHHAGALEPCGPRVTIALVEAAAGIPCDVGSATSEATLMGWATLVG